MKARILILAAACFIGACNGQTTIGSTLVASGATSAESPACPAEDFSEFLVRFVDDVQVQHAFTTSPLHVETVDASAEPEPTTITRMLSSSEIEFPVIPDSKRQSKDRLVQEVTKDKWGEMQLMLSKPDTDYQVTYHFRKESCWMLFKKVDNSL